MAQKIFITGSSASGKSTLGLELRKRGEAVIDIDEVIGACNWYEKGTGKIEQYKPGMGKDWLDNHEWNCDFEQIAAKIDGFKDSERVFVVGITTNQYSYLDMFDKIYLLRIDKETLLDRLINRTTNWFGKDASEQAHLLDLNDDFEKRMLDLGAVELDATKPLSELANRVLGG